MLFLSLVLAACALPDCLQAAALPHVHPDPDHGDKGHSKGNGTRNANHIFNAVHSSMRQWGSSINHNGMSLFLAQVPAGTQFYHGTGTPAPVAGLEWLAFEPEHARYFARRMTRPRQRHPPKGESLSLHSRPPSYLREEGDEGVDGWPRIDHLSPSSAGQTPLWPKAPAPPPTEPGWLHTYKTKDTLPLSLLYIDGMSAGKCDKGTLDSQDFLLLNSTANEGRDMFGERERAKSLCEMAEDRWAGKVKGFIRMEAGFEVILCSFHDSLDFVRAVRAGPVAPVGGEPTPDDQWWESDVNWIKAVTARYDGIGGERVRLDYDDFVTTYHYDLDLFTGEDALPRLENLSVTALDEVRNDVDAMVDNWDPSKMLPKGGSVNWQSIADAVVERYARELQFLVSGALTAPEAFFHELEIILRVFIDSDARNMTAEVDRCVAQFIPASAPVTTSIAGRAITSVTKSICSALFAAFDVNVPLAESVQDLRSLMEYLDWTVWKKCPECPLDKVCFIPIWPYGSLEDREHPQCRNASEMRGRMGYWNGPRGTRMLEV